MRSQTQERIEELARKRAAAAIDLALVEDGIEIGKQMMAEMIATYPTAGRGAAAPRGVDMAHEVSAARIAEAQSKNIEQAQDKAQVVPAVSSGYLNEVSSLTVQSQSGDTGVETREH